jgi:hypothetical protein
MLPFLHAAKSDGWHHIVTCDESWFFFDTSPRRIGTLSRDDVVTKSKHQIQSKNSWLRSYGIRLGSMLWQTCKWYQNEQRLLCNKYVYSTRTSDLSSKKATASKTTCDLSRQLLNSHKSGVKRVARRTWHIPHATATIFTWPNPSWLLFVSYSETKKLEWTRVADEDQFFKCLQEIFRVSIRRNWIGYFRLGYGGFKN